MALCLLSSRKSFLKAAWLCILALWLTLVVGFFSCQLFGRKCQDLLFMLLPGTVAQNVWFNFDEPSCAGGGEIWTTNIQVFGFSLKLDSDTRRNVPTDVQQLLIDSCTRGSLQFPWRLDFGAALFVAGSIWLQLMHLLPMCTKLTLYNYSITSLYSEHSSAQSSYKNKNVLKMLPSGFVFSIGGSL